MYGREIEGRSPRRGRSGVTERHGGVELLCEGVMCDNFGERTLAPFTPVSHSSNAHITPAPAASHCPTISLLPLVQLAQCTKKCASFAAGLSSPTGKFSPVPAARSSPSAHRPSPQPRILQRRVRESRRHLPLNIGNQQRTTLAVPPFYQECISQSCRGPGLAPICPRSLARHA